MLLLIDDFFQKVDKVLLIDDVSLAEGGFCRVRVSRVCFNQESGLELLTKLVLRENFVQGLRVVLPLREPRPGNYMGENFRSPIQVGLLGWREKSELLFASGKLQGWGVGTHWGL